jgi:thioredoxin reductase
MDIDWDCIVVGGGAAGLSAALVLGRARRRTLLVDTGRPSNAVAHGIGGLLGQDGRPPAALYADGRAELAAYPSVTVRGGEVVDGEAADGGFELTLADGGRETARRVLLATGMDYRFRDLPGFAERWGRSVFHCPFCHGWEVRERPLAVLAPGADGVRLAVLLRAWSDDVTLLADGPAGLSADQAAQLAAAGVEVDERRVAGVDGPGTELEAVAFADGSRRACGGLLVGAPLRARSPLAARLGAAVAAQQPPGYEALEVDGLQQTTVPGLYAAGDVAAGMPSVANAIASGSRAGAGVVHDLAAAAVAVPAS